ncbi:hypothetical protein QB953_004472 [Salmonella enterica]|nr:hypothetical protein [Salmonella enterica]
MERLIPRNQTQEDITEEARICIKFIRKHPYDRRQDDEAEIPNVKNADQWNFIAARAVIENLLGRRGIKWALEDVDDDGTRQEIIEVLAEIIREAKQA